MWHLLNYIPPRGKSRAALKAVIDSFNASLPIPPPHEMRAEVQLRHIELFAPAFISLTETPSGKVSRTERPLLYHYIFLRGQESDIKRLCLTYEGFSFVLDRADRSHITLSDESVEQFRILARYYAGKLPCYPLDGINLEEGDKVQIVTGPCAGLTGTYMSRKGGKSGNILVAVDTTMAAIVYDIPADYVRVLEFATNSRRVYDQLDAFAERLKSCLPGKGNTCPVLEFPVPSAVVFTRRLGHTRISNPKLDAKRWILLYAAYSILGDISAAAEALESFSRLSSHITNPKTRTLCDTILTAFPS